MSFITQTIKCLNCNYEMNIALGTFGMGMPKDCPDCKRKLRYKILSQGWNAKKNDDTIGG